MRIRSQSGRTHILGYCANVHPGETLAAITHAVSAFARPVREELASPELALGLWISRSALHELERAGSQQLRDALQAAGIFVATLNGFPYGDFHAPVVKRRVYHPDLGSDERRAYLLGLAELLVALMPDDLAEGTISTLPIGHRDEPHGYAPDSCSQRAARQLCRLSEQLAELRARSRRSIRVCLEPEPGCWLETTADAIAFFSQELPRAARELGVDPALCDRHLGLCYDTCHQAVCFETAAESIGALQRAGVRIGKAQLSSALELADPSDASLRAELLRFDEPRFLHQVRTRRDDGGLAMADDLATCAALPTQRPWRVHFHVPIHRAAMGRLGTTSAFLADALPLLAALPNAPHLEVETYTWSALPAGERPLDDRGLINGLAAELNWARARMQGALP